MMNRAWVYIELCSDGTYYVGSTIDLYQRIIDHNAGRYEGYTSARLPVKLLWSSEFSDIRYAFEYERKIKRWNRAKKEALMRENYDQPHLLSRSTMKEKLGTMVPFGAPCHTAAGLTQGERNKFLLSLGS